jgi:3-hydroxy-4-methylanthranilate adenylyltransferase
MAVAARSWWGEELLGRGADRAPWAGEVDMARVRHETAWLARVLGYQGIRAGSTVAFRGTPSFTQLWALFACWSLGAQVLLLERRIAGPESAALLDRCAPQFDITFGEPIGRQVFVDECGVLVARRRPGRPAGTPHCLIQFSAGTTGALKAIGRTPESILHELALLRDLDGLPGPGEPLLLLDSATSSFGLIGGVLRALDVGHPVLFATNRRPAAVVDTAAGAEVIIGTPRQFRALADGPAALPRLRTAVSYGDVLAPGVGERFAERFGVRIGQAYGTTETGIVAAELTGRYPSPHIGRPVPGVRTRIADGVLEVHIGQSPYLDRGDLPHGGWLSTHDLVSQDPVTGMLRLRGRFVPTGTHRRVHADRILPNLPTTGKFLRGTVLLSRNTDGAWRNDGEQHDRVRN